MTPRPLLASLCLLACQPVPPEPQRLEVPDLLPGEPDPAAKKPAGSGSDVTLGIRGCTRCSPGVDGSLFGPSASEITAKELRGRLSVCAAAGGAGRFTLRIEDNGSALVNTTLLVDATTGPCVAGVMDEVTPQPGWALHAVLIPDPATKRAKRREWKFGRVLHPLASK